MTAKRVLKWERFFLGSREVTGDANNARWDPEIAEVAFRVFGTGHVDAEPGLEEPEVVLEIVGNEDASEDAVLEALGGTSGLWSGWVPAAADGVAVVGDLAYMFRGGGFQYEQRARIGEMKSAVVRLASQGEPLVRGQVAELGASRAAPGVAAGVDLGAVATGRKLYVGLHVLAFDGTTLSAKVESDADDGFGTAVDRITFDAVTGVGWQFKSVAGPITDTHYRINFTAFTGTSFAAVAVLGIAA